ncbi:cupin domain-containing protein [Variovorax sp. J22G73]|uniref:cupin domain-containing protein n=1 Tax=unclassified Variovorax TaxID=663243 RepID=UPI000D5C6A1C|nr:MULTISPECIES: cupin domain-containing protein [unclassified Variovorax]MDM0007601.1 cupin domain-containing protein [Variovorax sp. J22R203]MDM0100039.1 cupin domain-containing protein [Variovorax sp. J22G73]
MTSTPTTTPTPASNPGPKPYLAVNLADKLSRLHEHWSQRVVAEMNDYQFKIAKLQGDFVWHSHADTDEAFLVVAGELRIDFRDGAVTLRAGDMFVVPRGFEHKPFAQSEAHVLLVEPRGVVNTGDAQSDRTRPNDLWA